MDSNVNVAQNSVHKNEKKLPIATISTRIALIFSILKKKEKKVETISPKTEIVKQYSNATSERIWPHCKKNHCSAEKPTNG